MIIIRPKPNPSGTRVYLLLKLIQLHSLNRWRCATDVLWVQVWHHEKVDDGFWLLQKRKTDLKWHHQWRVSRQMSTPLMYSHMNNFTHTHTHTLYQQDPQSDSSQATLRLIPHYCTLLQVSINRQHGSSFRKNNKPLRFFCLSFCFTHSSWAINSEDMHQLPSIAQCGWWK